MSVKKNKKVKELKTSAKAAQTERDRDTARSQMEAERFGTFAPPDDVIGLNAMLYLLGKFNYSARTRLIEYAANWNKEQEIARRKITGDQPGPDGKFVL